MNKFLLTIMTLGFGLAPSIASANVPVQVPEPATAILLLSVAGIGAIAARLKHL